jgi:hypothetical protein
VIELSTFIFETLRGDSEFILYQGRREADRSHLLLKELVSEHPSIRNLEQLEYEYSIREELAPDWAAQPIAIQRRE